MAEAGHEVASHSWRWIDYSGMPEDEERDHIRQTVATIRESPRGRKPRVLASDSATTFSNNQGIPIKIYNNANKVFVDWSGGSTRPTIASRQYPTSHVTVVYVWKQTEIR